MCSVPMKSWLSVPASSCAQTTTRRARSVNFSNSAFPIRRHGSCHLTNANATPHVPPIASPRMT
jgi:hypothetical protein